MKRALFVALAEYNRAYQYWALRPSRFQPSMLKSMAEQQHDLVDMAQDYADALKAFNPPPQAFGEKTFTVTEPTLLQQFAQTTAVTVAVPTDDALFSGFGRVRLSTVRVWLDGVRTRNNTPVTVEISNSGLYRDRLRGESSQFATLPLKRAFQYQTVPGKDVQILVDGRVADEQQFAYFQPTPFTEWTLKVPGNRNPGLDLSGLTQVRIEFAGSLINDD